MFIKINSLGGEPEDYITIRSLAKMICGNTKQKSINKVHYRLRCIDDTGLDFCHPHPDTSKLEDERTGPKFIVLNSKCKAFIHEFDGFK